MGPLAGVKVLEFEAIGPAPFAGMLLADMGADVLVVDRPQTPGLGLKRERWYDVMLRGKRSVTLDMKSARGAEAALALIARADALIEGFRSGRGQVIDAAMVDGAALLAAMFAGFLAAGGWSEERGANTLDSGAPWYDVYQTADGKYVAIGAIEDKFFAELCQRLQLSDLPAQHDRARWPEMRRRFAEAFKRKTRDEWCRVFEGSDACFAPVLSWSEARAHEHSRARTAYAELAKVPQPAPAPRFSRTAPTLRRAAPERGEGGREALGEWGFGEGEIAKLRTLGIGFL